MQHAALHALQGPQDITQQMKHEYQQRRDVIVKQLNDMGFRCPTPEGAFYVFPKIPEEHEHAEDSFRFANELLDNQHVALVHGTGFGREGHVRISYTAPMENIEQGMERIRRFLG